MILVDVNLLVYAATPEAAHHGPARKWLEARLTGHERVGLPWPTLLGYLRLVTHHRIAARPASMQRAWATVQQWLAAPNVWIPEPTPTHADVLQSLMPAVTRSEHVTDAHLAALAIEHGLTLCSADRGFARFEGLRWENPIAG